MPPSVEPIAQSREQRTRRDRLGGDPRVGVVDIALSHGQHRVNDVVMLGCEMLIERIEKTQIAPQARRAGRLHLHWPDRFRNRREIASEQGYGLPFAAERSRQIMRIPLRAPARRIGMQDD